MTITWTRNPNGTGTTTINDTDDAVARVMGLLRQTDMTGDRKTLAESIVAAVDLARRPAVPTRYEVVDRTDRQAMAAWHAGDPDLVGFDDDPNCRCIRGCACNSDSLDTDLHHDR